MHYKDVWDEIDRRRLFQSDAKQPWQAVGSKLYTDPAFRQTSPANFVLARKRGSRPTDMKLRDAIIQVLSSAGEPMHYKDVWDEIDRRKLFRSNAEQPWQAVGSKLYTDPAFRQTSSAHFVLAGRRVKGARDVERRGQESSKTNEQTDSLQFDPRITTEAEDTATHYKLFFCLEQSIRNLVSSRMEEACGPDWWTHVPQGVRDEAAKNRRRDEESPGGLRSNRPIDFVDFGHLSDIVQCSWSAFSGVISNCERFKKLVSSLNPIRAQIAHCVSLSEDNAKRLELAAGEWFGVQIRKSSDA
jgi:hypothetical protein